MPLNLQINSNVGPTAQAVADQDGNATSLTLSDRNVGIGTLAASQRLTLGSGNVFLPTANTGVDGNLYFWRDNRCRPNRHEAVRRRRE